MLAAQAEAGDTPVFAAAGIELHYLDRVTAAGDIDTHPAIEVLSGNAHENRVTFDRSGCAAASAVNHFVPRAGKAPARIGELADRVDFVIRARTSNRLGNSVCRNIVLGPADNPFRIAPQRLQRAYSLPGPGKPGKRVGQRRTLHYRQQNKCCRERGDEATWRKNSVLYHHTAPDLRIDAARSAHHENSCRQKQYVPDEGRRQDYDKNKGRQDDRRTCPKDGPANRVLQSPDALAFYLQAIKKMYRIIYRYTKGNSARDHACVYQTVGNPVRSSPNSRELISLP